MRTSLLVAAAVLAETTLLPSAAQAATTIDPANRFAGGANIGWVNFVGDTNNGAVVGEYVCSGYIYAANVGWIHLGDGTPANGVYYNEFNGDSGVNVGGDGGLHGLAWGANIGWVNFTTNGFPAQAPRIDLLTGKFSGFAWGANVGWISLSNAVASVRTDRITPGGDSDADGITDAWERERTGNLTTLSRDGDRDGDGVTDLREYLANTNPLDPSSNLVLGTAPISGVGPSPMVVNWMAMPGRVYRVEMRDNLDPQTPWVDSRLVANPSLISGVGPSPMRAVFGVGPSPLHQLFGVGPSPLHEVSGVGPSPMRIFQVRALLPADILGTPTP